MRDLLGAVLAERGTMLISVLKTMSRSAVHRSVALS
jgi:hypothetical protein